MENKIIQYLIEKYNPEIIFLWGSRVKWTNHDKSDWDLYLIWDFDSENEQISEIIFWEHLDIALFQKKIIEINNILKIFYWPLSFLKIILDNKEQLWGKILKYTQKYYLKWPEKILISEKESELIYLKRLLSKIIAYKKDNRVSFFHIAQFYRVIIPLWFKVNWKWSLPINQAIYIIKDIDYLFFSELEKISSWVWIDEKIESCMKILKHLEN